MTLSLLGSHWMHPDRELHGRMSFSVELVYRRDAPPGFDVDAVRERVKMVHAKGAKVALRADDGHGQSLPPQDTDPGDYVEWCQMLAADPDLGACDWLVCGNEPNLAAENLELGRPAAPTWPARVVYGHGTGVSETSNVYQYVRTVNPTMQVLLPAVGPYSPEASGVLAMPMLVNMDAATTRSAWAPWEHYQYDLMVAAYDNNWHADIGEVKTAAHTYAVGWLDQIGASEPFTDCPEQTYGAQFGSRWLQDCLFLLRAAQETVYGSEWAVWTLVTEANVYRPPQTEYVSGWWTNLVKYVDTLPNIMGLAAFVDQNLGGGWTDTCMTSGTAGAMQWDMEHDHLLASGWV